MPKRKSVVVTNPCYSNVRTVPPRGSYSPKLPTPDPVTPATTPAYCVLDGPRVKVTNKKATTR